METIGEDSAEEVALTRSMRRNQSSEEFWGRALQETEIVHARAQMNEKKLTW